MSLKKNAEMQIETTALGVGKPVTKRQKLSPLDPKNKLGDYLDDEDFPEDLPAGQRPDILGGPGVIGVANSTPTNCEQWKGHTINCIQFFRLSFRSALKELGDSTFLKSLYMKGCAIYCPTNTEAIDLVMPCYHAGNDECIPIFVSVKTYAQLYVKEVNDFLQTSYDALKGLGIDRGLLLLGIAGQLRS